MGVWVAVGVFVDVAVVVGVCVAVGVLVGVAVGVGVTVAVSHCRFPTEFSSRRLVARSVAPSTLVSINLSP